MIQKLLYLSICTCVLLQGCTLWHTKPFAQPPKPYLTEYAQRRLDANTVKMIKILNRGSIYGSKLKDGSSVASVRKNGVFGYDLSKLNSSPEKGLKQPSKKVEFASVKSKVSDIIDKSNRQARVKPDEKSFHGAIVEYEFKEGSIFSIYTALLKTTVLKLQKGERIISVSGGDTANWLIEHVIAREAPHLIVKPVDKFMETNITIITDKRTYFLFVKSWKNTYMSGCRWRYPKEKLLANEKKMARQKKEMFLAPDLRFDYFSESDCYDCIKPEAIYADIANGKLYLDMPASIQHVSLPALFALGNNGTAEMINYRFVDGRKFIIDTLYPRVILRYGGSKGGEIRIYKEDCKPKSTFSFLDSIFGK